MSGLERLKLIHLVAEMYYVGDKTQQEIAKELSISRPKVSRLLNAARDENIVQIRVVNPFANIDLLTQTLQEKLQISTVIVVPGANKTQNQIRKHLGYATARYLESSIQTGDVVGMGWGRTLHEVVHALESGGDKKLTAVPLMGGLGQVSPSFQVHSMSRVFCEKLGGTWQPLYVPAIVENPEVRQSLLASSDAQQVKTQWARLTVALMGIGNIDLGPEVQMLFADYLDDGRFTYLAQLRAVGDICMRFFDVDGQPIVDGLPGVMSIELAQLRQVPRRIGVAGGAEKAEAILGAVRGGYINVLITDETAVTRILEIIKE